ncbi:MAG: DUF1298 domain-containing protein [Comamonadaceae bacterium]|nr:DUF1298 domain-containing protein [Rubrivivax sp.]NLZ39734.1 DUF1298 domain-containing protein [Comamonadaceae bacterium]
MSTPVPRASAALRSWGGSADLAAPETLLWRSEVDPRLRATMVTVLVLDRAPDWGRFRRDHQWLVQAVPRLAERVAQARLGTGLSWVHADDFDLGYHLRRVSLPAPGSERQLLDLAQSLAMTPLDKSRPPWQGTLIEGLEGGRAAYVLKLHHAIADGLGVVQLMNQLLGTPNAAAAGKAARRRAPGKATPLPSADMPVASDVALGLAGLWQQGARTAQQALDYAVSATKVLALGAGAGSPILRRRSLSMRFDTLEFALDEFKAAARACEGTVNDVLLAGLMGGWRRYHELMGVPVARMPIGFPINVRKEGDPTGGNRFAALRYAAPVGEVDPIARVRDVQQFLRTMRAEPALDVMMRLTPALAALPATLAAQLAVGVTSALDAQVSNVPGMAGPARLSGVRITQVFPFGPRPGCPMMITMASHDGRCCIGVNSDPAAVIDPEAMTDSLRAGLQEMMALADPPTRPKRGRRHGTR